MCKDNTINRTLSNLAHFCARTNPIINKVLPLLRPNYSALDITLTKQCCFFDHLFDSFVQASLVGEKGLEGEPNGHAFLLVRAIDCHSNLQNSPVI